ncbi:MAG: DUF2191 domain-containing protein [Betaproteobacteria bacterium]|nr:DUF2191 domain-containing protein [Betaproteobacteria bacterium]
MKTTVEISDALLEETKKIAAREDVPVRTLIEQGLRQVIAQRKQRRGPFRLRKATFGGRGLTAEARAAGPERLRELAYEGRGG